MTAPIGIGQLGAGFIGQVHSLSYRLAAMARSRVRSGIRLVSLADTDATLRREVADRYGWEADTDDWRSIVDDPDVRLFVNAGPNALHGEPSIAAAHNGKHVLCEKPLARTADEAFDTYRRVQATGVLHQCAFMYRFIPAIRYAHELIAAGELGEVLHFRSRFLMSFALDRDLPMSWRLDKAVAGAGALGDLGSHHIDLARFLVAEPVTVAAHAHTFIHDRPGGRVSNDDSFAAVARLANGATASFEASRVAGGHGLSSRIEIDGTKGSLLFDLERLNELSVSLTGAPGFRTFLVTAPEHPWADFLFPVGVQGQHPIGWEVCFAHQAQTMLRAIDSGEALPDTAPTFRDGYRVAEVVDSIDRATGSGSWEPVTYREADTQA
ncbi:Gfo/Idh/MocA family oxidoreductase [Dactylosporangium sp. AC04546]|uniref:Gfo/Idh/MocA family protein n=1 Tax=Dactylosporangium sp. AC04546 TaxID=2862460 RepID=UPI001EDC942F|nr:Gfo/Idh/MocA family oxidoreductase [Dactylosporangium sp. AC04546]WVK81069.1 Gfo/Idh/MocA family oxidoreductase [Dactylosporangium sp. AC04546]